MDYSALPHRPQHFLALSEPHMSEASVIQSRHMGKRNRLMISSFLVLLQLVYSLEDYGLLHVWLLSKHLKQIVKPWITLSNTAVLNFSKPDTVFVELGCCNFHLNHCVYLPIDQLPLLERWWMGNAKEKHDLFQFRPSRLQCQAKPSPLPTGACIVCYLLAPKERRTIGQTSFCLPSSVCTTFLWDY